MPNFPTALDTLTNPSATDYLNSPSHAGQHATANDILEALETKVGITGVGFNPASDSAPASVVLHEDTDNGINKITVTAPSAIASDKTLTLPDATDTLVGKDTTDTLTNKTLSTGTKVDANADANITQYGMARQAIINGNFDVWQRGTSVALTDNVATFLADRYADYVNKDGGTLPTLTRSRQLQTSGDVANSFYFTRLATNGAGTSLGVNSTGYLLHNIENGTAKLCGLNKKVTVSFLARSSIANKRLCPTLLQRYGSGGSPTANETILGTPITLTSSWVKYTATFTTNTLVGKTFGTAADDSLMLALNYVWGTTYGNANVQASVTAETFVGAGNIDIAQVQLCSGDVALPFQPKSFEEELRACMRYYEKSYAYSVAPATATIIGANKSTIHTAYILSNGVVYFKNKKRTSTPTITFYSANGTTAGVGSEYNNGSSFVADRALIADATSDDMFSCGGSAGNFTTTAFPNGSFVRFNWTAESEL